jgi:hypothetical protein
MPSQADVQVVQASCSNTCSAACSANVADSCLPVHAAGVQGSGIIACTFLARFFIYSAFNALWALCPEM